LIIDEQQILFDLISLGASEEAIFQLSHILKYMKKYSEDYLNVEVIDEKLLKVTTGDGDTIALNYLSGQRRWIWRVFIDSDIANIDIKRESINLKDVFQSRKR
jgi:hypothetical protein